jgi:hypothetical protein
MKKTTLVMAGMAALLPLSGMASVTVNAPSSDGGWAILFNPLTAEVYDQQQFSGTSGSVSLSTDDMVVGSSKWAVDITYDAAKVWQSRVYWESTGVYTPTRTWDNVPATVTALTGEIISRNYDVSTPGARKLSVTYRATDTTAVTLQGLNNDDNALDAYLSVYRPTTETDNIYSPDMTKTWDPDTLQVGYTPTYEVAASDANYTVITITKDDGTFAASYVGRLNTEDGTYDIGFESFDDPGDTAYWSTTDTGLGDGVYNELDGTVTFTSTSSNTDALEDFVPYYVYMDRAEMFDDLSTPDASLTYARDGGLTLVDYDYYAIPEPAAIMLLLGGGGVLFATRRIFMI